MVEQALRRLGYLDGHLSCDLAEALLAFVNLPETWQPTGARFLFLVQHSLSHSLISYQPQARVPLFIASGLPRKTTRH